MSTRHPGSGPDNSPGTGTRICSIFKIIRAQSQPIPTYVPSIRFVLIADRRIFFVIGVIGAHWTTASARYASLFSCVSADTEGTLPPPNDDDAGEETRPDADGPGISPPVATVEEESRMAKEESDDTSYVGDILAATTMRRRGRRDRRLRPRRRGERLRRLGRPSSRGRRTRSPQRRRRVRGPP